MPAPISPLAQSIVDELKKIRLSRINLDNPLDRLLVAGIIDGQHKRIYGNPPPKLLPNGKSI